MSFTEGMPLNILIVEDDRDAQLNLQDILELEGHQTQSAYCAAELRGFPTLEQFDVILLDWKLPDARGDGLLPELRERAPLVAVIVVTGYADTTAAITALRHGATDFLTKPIEPELLQSRLNKVSEQRRMREELAETQRSLIQSERLAAIGQTIAALSHEARNELHGLRMGLTLLPKILDNRETTNRVIAQLSDNELRLHRLFEEVRDFAAPIQLQRTLCHIDEIWRRAWDSLQRSWQDRDVLFEEHLEDSNLWLPVDAFRLEQVFRNLFENSLAACTDPVTIRLSSERVADRSPSITLSIRDNGPGLTKEQQQKVFVPFFTTKSSGTGLGMTIVKRIVEAHGGTIRVAQDAFHGAEFIITLPMATAQPAILWRPSLEAEPLAKHHSQRGEPLFGQGS